MMGWFWKTPEEKHAERLFCTADGAIARYGSATKAVASIPVGNLMGWPVWETGRLWALMAQEIAKADLDRRAADGE